MNSKRILIIGLILLVLIIDFSSFASGNYNSVTSNTTLIPNQSYEALDIDLKDAAYHKSYGRYHSEWWYFEGIFDNGYSVVVGVSISSKVNRGICKYRIDIYNDTKLEFCLRKYALFKEFEASEEYPFIKISEKPVVVFDREHYNQTGEWVYNVTMEIEKKIVNLTFIGTTRGFKGEALRGWYGPVMPQANVSGTITINGEEMNVKGLGYHEHAWELHFPIWEWGWYWGKIVSDSHNLFWAKMMQTRWKEQGRAAILSNGQSGYININPENIDFKVSNYKFNSMRLIPTKFILKVSDSDNSIYINATMETIDLHHSGGGLIHYWRYHILVNGQITNGSTTEIIKDQIQIMEFVRFR